MDVTHGTDVDLLTVSQAAAVAGVSLRTMRRWVSTGQVVTVGRGRGRRVVASSLSKPGDTSATDGHVVGAMGATETATSDMGDIGDMAASVTSVTEADRLAALVRELTLRLAEQTALTAVFQERCRVLAERLALAAPPESPVDASTAAQPPNPTPAAPWRSPWLYGAVVVLAIVVVVALRYLSA